MKSKRSLSRKLRRRNYNSRFEIPDYFNLESRISNLELKVRRPERLAETLREEITEIVGFELVDPRLLSVTVTEVRVSDNLRDARVFVVVEGSEIQIKEALQALQHAATFIRQQVTLNLSLRHAPHLNFVRDTVEENAARVGELLQEIGLTEEEAVKTEDEIE